LVGKISDAASISQETMREALQVEWNSEMRNPTSFANPDLPGSAMSDPARTKEKVRGRASSNHSDGLQQHVLQELLLTSRKRFIQIAYRVLRNNEDAEDAVQDAFVSACRHFGKFEGRCALTTWLTRIVMNAALMARRKKKSTRYSFRELDAAISSFAETVPDTQPNPEQAYSRAEAHEILDVHLKELSPLLREAVVTTYYAELSVTEASSAVRVPLATYKARLFRGRRLLQQRTAAMNGSPFRSSYKGRFTHITVS
jgi:RNA polymerase sigma-70 factor (ECF subfamily)